jgi:hypothetical protein
MTGRVAGLHHVGGHVAQLDVGVVGVAASWSGMLTRMPLDPDLAGLMVAPRSGPPAAAQAAGIDLPSRRPRWQGSPAMAIQGGYSNLAGVAFDSAVDETCITAPILFHDWWQSFVLDIDWCAQGNVSGNAYFEVRYGPLSPATPEGWSTSRLSRALPQRARSRGRSSGPPLSTAHPPP